MQPGRRHGDQIAEKSFPEGGGDTWSFEGREMLRGRASSSSLRGSLRKAAHNQT